MRGEYENLSARDLREMFLKNALDADLMRIEEYEKLFGYEMERGEPSADVLDFCTQGLNRYEKYRRDIQKTPFGQIAERAELKGSQNRKNHRIKIFRRIAAVVAVTVITAFLAQGVSAALGYDLFRFIYNWLSPETVLITTTEMKGDGSHDSPFRNDGKGDGEEFVYTKYERLEDIDETWLDRVSPYLTSKYEFFAGTYSKLKDSEKFSISFLDENGVLFYLAIQDYSMIYIEKDDEGFVKELAVNDITFFIFNNTEDFQVVWEHEGYLYNLGAHLPLEEIEEIARNYY